MQRCDLPIFELNVSLDRTEVFILKFACTFLYKGIYLYKSDRYEVKK